MKKSNISKIIGGAYLTSIITALLTIFVDDKKYPLTKVVRNSSIIGILILSIAAYIVTISDKSDEEE